MLLAERTTEEIAELLRISPKTVANLHSLVKDKLGVGSDIELVRLALRQGIFLFKPTPARLLGPPDRPPSRCMISRDFCASEMSAFVGGGGTKQRARMDVFNWQHDPNMATDPEDRPLFGETGSELRGSVTRVVREQTLVEDYNAMSTDLSRYKARGGKLLMYHGLADPIVTPQNTLYYYYSAVEKAAGGSVTDYFRLFTIPGMDHCGLPGQAGPGITEAGFDPLTALEKWVEDGVAPDSMLATKARCNGTSPGRHSMSASLIGHSGSSTFRLSTCAVSMSLAGSCFSKESAPGPFHHGIRGRGGTISWAALPSVERQNQADIRTRLIHRPARDMISLLGDKPQMQPGRSDRIWATSAEFVQRGGVSSSSTRTGRTWRSIAKAGKEKTVIIKMPRTIRGQTYRRPRLMD